MRVPLQIARRYLFGKKKTNAINYITGISVVGIAIGTSALILILSVFNGFESLTKKYLDSFNPDMLILPVSGKYFEISEEQYAGLNSNEEVENFSKVIEEVAHFEYNSRQLIGIIKGVDDRYIDVTRLDEAISSGEVEAFGEDDRYFSLVGAGVYRNLNINLSSKFHTLKLSVPNRSKRGVLDRDFKTRSLDVSGVFTVRSERDNQYVITDYRLVSGLLDLQGQVSSIELKLVKDSDITRVKSQLQNVFPKEQFSILDRLEQDASVLKIMNVEKWSSYLIFSFTLLLIVFNVIGCLWMIVLDKRKDLSVLQSFGATKRAIRQIFLFEGVMISSLGFLIGLVFSGVFYFIHKKIGIITVPEGFDIVSYPMEMIFSDVAIVFLTVLFLGVIASLPAAYRASRVSAYVRME